MPPPRKGLVERFRNDFCRCFGVNVQGATHVDICTNVRRTFDRLKNGNAYLSPRPLGEGARSAGEGICQRDKKIKPATHRRLRCAFTLAEVLITLGVIGIVAALTLPTLVANYRNKVLLNQAKNSYSKLANALTMVRVHNGYDNFEDFLHKDLTNDQMLEIIVKELKTIKVCKEGKSGCTNVIRKARKKTYNNGETIGNNYKWGASAILADGSFIVVNNFTNQRQSGCHWVNSYPKRDEAGNIVKDENGNEIIIDSPDNRCGQIIVDVNGDKGPNQGGADTFSLGIYPGNVLPNYDTFLYNDQLNYENYEIGEKYE